jgi:heme exporter protein B
VPVLIFGVAAVTPFVTGPNSLWAPLLMLSALSLAAIVLAPLACAAALRTALR